MSRKGYSSVSTVDNDSDEVQNKPQSMTEMLKQSANRRQQRANNVPDSYQNKPNNLPPIDHDDDTESSNDDDININANTNPPPNRGNTNDQYGNNIGNIPGTSGSVTNCMNKSWKICTLFGIEIHIHVLLPLFFIATFLVWLQLILKDTGNTVYYIALIFLFNVALWECILIHELGHCLAGYLVGGHTDKVLLWPLGGLAFTQPPAQLNNADGDSKRRKNHIIIAFGGPLTHIPHMIIYGLLIMWYCKEDYYGYGNCPYGQNVWATSQFWQETIISLPNGEGLWFWYDFLMIGFMLNFWLFIINLFIPAYPLDGSRIFMNFLLGRYDRTTSATIYCWITGFIAVIAIVIGAIFFQTQTMLLFTGVWAAFQVYQLSMLIHKSSEHQHPLLNQS